MALFFKREKQITIKCRCGAEYKKGLSVLATSETDKKGELCFYTYCKECGRLVFFEETKLPRRFVKNSYKNHVWFG